MKILRSSIVLLLGLIPFHSAHSAATIFDGWLALEEPEGIYLEGGHVFLKVTDDVVDYSIWLDHGSTEDVSITFIGAASGSFGIDFDAAITIQGCDTTPRNPFLPTDPLPEIIVIPEGEDFTCPSQRTFNQFVGSFTDATVADLLRQQDRVAAVMSTDYVTVLSPIPEPSTSFLVLIGAALAILKRSRPNKMADQPTAAAQLKVSVNVPS